MHLRGQALIVCLINLEYVDGQICPVFEIKWLNIMTDHLMIVHIWFVRSYNWSIKLKLIYFGEIKAKFKMWRMGVILKKKKDN